MKKLRLTEVCDFQGGSQPPKEQWTNKPENGYVRMLQIRDFTQGKNEKEYVKLSNTLKFCDENDILIARYGASVGKILTGLAGAYNVAIINSIPDLSKLLKRYLFYYFNSEYFQNKIKSVGSRAAQAGFNKNDLEDFEIFVPTLEFQQQIVEILDKGQQLINKRKEQIEALDELVKSRFIEMFGDPVSNPKSWNKGAIGSVVKSITAGWSVNGEAREKREGEKVVLKVSAVTQGYFKDDEYKVIGDDVEIKKYVFPEKGDLLFSRANTREMVGATCIIHKDYPDLLLPDKLWKVLFIDRVNAFYMKYVLSEASIRAEFSAKSTGTSGSMYNVSMDKFKNIEIPVPPIELQNEFADFVKQVDKLKFEMEQSLKELEDNFNSLMQKAFKGELF